MELLILYATAAIFCFTVVWFWIWLKDGCLWRIWPHFVQAAAVILNVLAIHQMAVLTGKPSFYFGLLIAVFPAEVLVRMLVLHKQTDAYHRENPSEWGGKLMRRRRTALVKLVNNFYGCWLWFAAVLAAWFLYNLIG